MSRVGAMIRGIGSSLPERVLTNFDLEEMVDTSDEWIRTRTGISERRIAGEGEATSDLAVMASRKALSDAGLSPKDIDLVVVSTVTPDMFFPSTACLVQAALGMEGTPALDLNAACSGLIYGLSVCNAFIATGEYNRILLIGAETLSKIVDWTDRNTCVLFGDGAAAVALQRSENGHGILSTHLGSDGTNPSLLCVPGGGTRMPISQKVIEERSHYIKMEGKETFKKAVRAMVESSLTAIEKAGIAKNEIDWFIPHQANLRIIQAVARELDIPMEKVCVNIDRYGNTSAASIGLALDEAVRDERIKSGDVIVMTAFGGGFTWASCVIRW
jgi:3-oxoacyl-[acyl-carrier-protein] synthase-3